MLDDGKSSRRGLRADHFPSLTERESAHILCKPGIDKISVSFPLENFDRSPSSWDRVSTLYPETPRQARSYGVSVPLGEGLPRVFVGVQEVEAATGPAFGKVECNPSRVADPEGWGLAPVGAVRDALHQACDAALEVLRPGCQLEEMRVKRLDVARDFSTDHGEFYLRGLAPVHRPYARQNMVHYDTERKGAQTLMVGSGAGMVRLYDKAAETEGRAPAGTLRWEAECRSAWSSKYGGIESVQDVNEENVQRLAQNRWEWSAMGTDVGAIERVVERARRSDMSAQQLCSFLGYVTLLANGGGHHVHRNTARKYRVMSRELGVSIGELEAHSAEFLGHLDFATGQEVLHAA